MQNEFGELTVTPSLYDELLKLDMTQQEQLVTHIQQNGYHPHQESVYEQPKEGVTDLGILDIHTILASEKRIIRHPIIDDMLYTPGLTLLGAKTDTGKSRLARFIAYCIDLQKPVFGHTTYPCPIFIILTEDSIEDAAEHLALLYGNDAIRNVHILNDWQDIDWRDPDTGGLHNLRRLARAYPGCLVFIDLVYDLLPLVGGYRKERKAMRALAKLAYDEQFGIVGLTHNVASEKDSSDDMYGSQGLVASARIKWRMRKAKGSERVTFTVEGKIAKKLRYTIQDTNEHGWKTVKSKGEETAEEKTKRENTVHQFIENTPPDVKLHDLKAAFADLSDSTLRRTLEDLVQDGKIGHTNRGPYWNILPCQQINVQPTTTNVTLNDNVNVVISEPVEQDEEINVQRSAHNDM